MFIVLDGVADRPCKELRNRTPLEAAQIPNLNLLAEQGKTGLVEIIGKGIVPESDVAVLAILGYDPFKCYTYHSGRGSLEAIGAGMRFVDGWLALRCNFATVQDGRRKRKRIIDRRAGRISSEEASVLAKAINSQVRLESYPCDFEFRSTIEHRGVLVIRPRKGRLSSQITNVDPVYGKLDGISFVRKKIKLVVRRCEPMNSSREAIISAKLVNEFVEKSYQVLKDQELNKKRKRPANIILTRDSAIELPKLFPLAQRFDLSWGAIVDLPLEVGIAKLAGMKVIEVKLSKDLAEGMKLRAEKVLSSIPSYDAIYIHLKGPDIAGHDGNAALKKRLIELIDQNFFGRILNKIDLRDVVFCVTSDHATPCELRSHSDDWVPLLISGGKTKRDEVSRFNEIDCRGGSIGLIKALRIMEIATTIAKV